MTNLYDREYTYADGREDGNREGFQNGQKRGKLQALREMIAYMREQAADWPELQRIGQLEIEMRKRFSK